MIPTFRSNILDVYQIIDNDKSATKVFEIDWDNNRLLSRHIDGSKAIDQTINVICSISLKETDIMPDWFGNEFSELYGMPRSFVKANIERLIKEALSDDDRIIKLENFRITDLEKAIAVHFTIVAQDSVFEKEITIENV